MMSKTLGIAACITLASGLSACSSTSSPGTAADGGGSVFSRPDAAGASGDDSGASGGDAGVAPIGEACATNADCTDEAGATALCTNQVFKAGPLFPTPVCMSINCTAATTANEIAFCGNDTGLCEPGQNGNPNFCFPLCTVTAAGVVGGCLANDTCQVAGIASDSSNAPILIGMCQPGCTADAQCPTGSKCDTLEGDCVATVTPLTGAFGSTCNPTTDQSCICVGPTGGTVGICSSVCATGGAACPQPTASATDGGATDGGAPKTLPFVCSAQLGGLNATDAGITFATQPPGLDGLCFPSCDTNADCAGIGSTAVCTPDPAGGTHKGICTFP